MEKELIHKRYKWLQFSLQKAVVHLYFFFNSVGLNGGLLYTNILTPWFIVWITKKGYLRYLIKTLAYLLPFSIIHFLLGIDNKSFVISHALFISTIVFVIVVYIYVNYYKSLKSVFKQILVFNFILTLVALPFYFSNYEYQKLFWYTNVFTTQKQFTRLSLFTFEASYYSLLLVPIVYYYFLRFILELQIIKGRYTLMMAIIPLLLSMSFGVIGGTVITGCVLLWINKKNIIQYKTPLLIIATLIFFLVTSLVTSFMFFSDILIIKRIDNIISGYDSSTNGRTFESFGIAWKIACEKSKWFGCGLGQVKLLMPDVVKTYYGHWGQYYSQRIPNAMAETLAVFGIIGVLVRLIVEIYFFFKTKVYNNYYQLALFIFIFIYQFTGSYITNIVEYVIWIFAFSTVFSEFDKLKKHTDS